MSDFQNGRRHVRNPEMHGVDLERDDLIYFKADQTIRDIVLNNSQAGTSGPFLGDLLLLDEDGF